MKHRNLSILGLSLLLSSMAMPMFSQVVSNDNEDEVNKVDQRFGQDFVPGQVLVKMKDSSPANVRKIQGKFKSAGISKLDAVLQEFGVEDMEKLLPNEKPGRKLRKAKAFNGSVVQERDLSQLYLLQMNEEKAMETEQLVDRLSELPEVEYAEPNYKAYITADVNCFSLEPLFSQLWGLTAINMPNMWLLAPKITQKRPVIALLDTGVDISHPDLAANIWTNTAEAEGEEGYDNDNNGFKNDVHGWDFINQTGNISDFNGHGTHCAGIAAAIGDNHLGIVGANPEALIMPITIMQSDGTGDIATIIRGIDYATAMGADILSMSIGTYSTSTAFEQALGRAYQNAILVAAAGNDGYCLNHEHPEKGQKFPMPMFPAAYNFVLGVQASAASGAMAGFSNYDDDGSFFSAYSEDKLYNYELRAPGASIMSIWPGGRYRSLNGTSMACPLVAGALSRLIQCKEIDSKEELFGDLIHSKALAGDLDIYKAYQMNDENRRPTLSFVTYTVDDSEGDGDGLIDAGETIAIYPTLRNDWGQANNIRISIELGDMEDPNVVDFLDSNVALGSDLSCYAKSIATTPLRLKISENCADNRHIKLVLKATCDDTNTVCENNFVIEVKNVTKFSGMITQDTTLEGDKTYYIDKDILVSGCTLTIEPGARLEFAESKTMKLVEGAHLKAHGTPQKKIVFKGEGVGGNIKCPWNSYESVWTDEARTTWSLYKSEETPVAYSIRYGQGMYSTDKVGSFHPDFSTYSLVKDDEHPYSVSTISTFPDTIHYCFIQNMKEVNLYMEDCIVSKSMVSGYGWNGLYGKRINYTETTYANNFIWDVYYSNLVNLSMLSDTGMKARYVRDNNFFNLNNNLLISSEAAWSGGGDGTVTKLYRPSYFGTSREDLLRPHIYEFGNADGIYTTLDLSNMRTEPVPEAHGIVWKVVVNGYDAQDEFEQLPPLGVGRHKFEVYFNRPMNKEVAPQISFGVRVPYTQQAVAEDGSWNEEGTIYTAYKTITGKTKSDGLNRIYVYGAEDNEFFEIPYEKTRFNINIQAAGSMATGFAGEAGLGRVNLTWNNNENNFEDAMGFNVYRYEFVEKDSLDRYGRATGVKIIVPDTIRINQDIVDIEATSYIDYDVKPGETYYYYYKVLSTDLQEYDVSNVVAVTPLTGEQGDANGSGDVDVADVITTVNYAAGQQPKPFIFEAADMNTDLSIDILDVIGIIKVILHPESAVKAAVNSTATYTIENGTLYVDSPVALAGVQVQLAVDAGQEITVADDLKGFEHTSAWFSDNDYFFMAYSMAGKTLEAGRHALLHLGSGKISKIRLSDADGHNVEAIGDLVTRVNRMATDVMTVKGIYDLQGRKLTGDSSREVQLPKGVYIVNGKKVVR